MKTVQDIADAVRGKKVIMRADFNVPTDDDGNITNDRRIRATLPTIRFLLDHGAALILASHLGRPKGKVKDELRLGPVADRLRELLGDVSVEKADDCIGQQATAKAAALQPGQVLVLENVRFHAEEEDNDPEFAKKLAALADFYVMDAFGTAHRAHASTEGIAHILPAAAGLIVEKEVDYLTRATEKPEHPYVAIMGGAKVSDKIGVINNLLPKVDKILIGGAMAYPFLKSMGVEIGKSKCDEDDVPVAAKLLADGGNKLVLPVDHVCGDDPKKPERVITTDGQQIPEDLMGLDIGPKTVEAYTAEIARAKMVVWNGPMGFSETPEFAAGTKAVLAAMAEADAVTIVGGGETAEAAEKFGLDEKIDHVSTGGGACLEFLEGRKLPGLEVLS
jgi:phosphoglycerate kinase